MHKGTNIISELNGFFKENDENRGIYSIMSILNYIRIGEDQIGMHKNPNCKMTIKQVFILLVIFPFFMVKNPNNYAKSALNSIFKCHRNMLYRFMQFDNIDWRKIIYIINRQIWKTIRNRVGAEEYTHSVRTLIIDDTDFEKTGTHMEAIGKVFSHVKMKQVLGFKGLFTCFSDGKTQSMIDMSIHGEIGKDKTPKRKSNKGPKPKPLGLVQGLTKVQRDARYTKFRDVRSKAQERKEEYLTSKIANAIDMVKRAISNGFRFDYLLCDSWFTCTELVRFIKTRHIRCHLLGMIKLGKTKYDTEFGVKTANQIVEHVMKKKNQKGILKHWHDMHMAYFTINAKLDGMKVRLYFCRSGRNGKWSGLLTTNMELDFKTAYHTYARRWVIEVSFHEMKSLLNLGKSQARDFSSQIASISLTMIQYNVLTLVKRFESYETIGGLFRDCTKESLELSVNDRIWEAIIEVVAELAELTSGDVNEIMMSITQKNERFNRIMHNYNLKNVA